MSFNYPHIHRDRGFAQRFCLKDHPHSHGRIQLLAHNTTEKRRKAMATRQVVIDVYGMRQTDKIFEGNILRIAVCPTLDGNTINTGRSFKPKGVEPVMMLVTNGKHINLISPGQDIFLQTDEPTTYLDIIFLRTRTKHTNISKATTIYENINGQSLYHLPNYFVMKRGDIIYTYFTRSTADDPASTADDNEDEDEDDASPNPHRNDSEYMSSSDDTESSICDEEETSDDDRDNLDCVLVSDICGWYSLTIG